MLITVEALWYDFYMEEQQKNNKIGRKLDRLIIGVILGGAIGSVLGLTLAPKKGKETREIIKQKGKELIEKGKTASEKFVRDHHEKFESAKYQMKKGRGFFRWLFRKNKTEQEMPKVSLGEDD